MKTACYFPNLKLQGWKEFSSLCLLSLLPKVASEWWHFLGCGCRCALSLLWLFLPLQSAPSALSREPYPSATHYHPRLTFGYALMFSLVSDYPQISTLLVLCLCIFQWAEARLIKRNIYLHFVHIDFNKQEKTQWSLASTHQYNHNICGLLIF